MQFLLVLLGVLAAGSPASAAACVAQVALEAGAGCFQFKDVAAPAPVSVFYYVPKKAAGTTPILFSLHGMSRTAQSHRDIWIQEAEKRTVVVLAPEFSKKNFPSEASYNLGNMGFPKADVAENLWGFSLVERLYDAVRSATKSQTAGYFLFGHSAGAQFVERMVLFKPKLRVLGAVAANAGFYAIPSFDVPYPDGVGKSPVTKGRLEAALKLPLTVLLGDKDNDVKDPKLAKGKAAAAQGSNRVERGKNLYAAAKAKAAELKVAFTWKLQMAPGVAHDPAGCVVPAAKAFWP